MALIDTVLDIPNIGYNIVMRFFKQRRENQQAIIMQIMALIATILLLYWYFWM